MATVLALGLRLLQLTRPGHLLGVTEYDDGVYFGAAIRLVHGVVPYRDFILVQPPGLILLMSPLAALSRAMGTAPAMAAGRILTACAGAASVPLGGLLVRHRGLVAVVIACGILAISPEAVLAAHTVLQEPWLVLFCLLGLLALFDGDRLSVRMTRLAWGGTALGFAGAVKLWAIFPIAVLLVMSARRLRQAAAYAGGVTAGFLIPVLPFAIMAPSSFYHGVFAAQLARLDDVRVPLWLRLADLTGATSAGRGTVLLISAAVAVACLGCCAAACVLTGRPPPPLESFSLISAALVLVSFMWPVDFYYHYACFFTPFLALSLALPVARLVTAVRARAEPRVPRLDLAAAGVAVISILALAAGQAHTEAMAKAALDPAQAARVIPAGACVLTDQVSLTIAAGRFTSDVPGCSQIVDGFGTDLDLSGGRNGRSGAARTPAVRAVWDRAFRAAQYVWLSSGLGPSGSEARRIAWTPSLRAYFGTHFRRVPGRLHLYRRVSPSRT